MSTYSMGDPQVIVNNFITISGIMEDFGIFMGLILCLLGFYQLKRYGESRTMMSSQMTIAGPILTIIGGLMLMSLPTMIEILNDMFFDTYNLTAYTGGSVDSLYDTYQVVIVFVRVIGIGALINAFIKLSRAGGSQSSPGNAGKAFMFIVGGVMCLNCVATVDLVMNLFDLQ